jgi:hypothetical protein
MIMKNKILISLVACFVAAGSFLHFNLALNNNNSDISLADISVMAQADIEEVTITCNASPWTYPGQCWYNLNPTPWWEPGKECVWTGNQAHNCSYVYIA